MTSMPASRSARAMTLAPRSWPSSPGFAMTTRILPAIDPIVGRSVPRRGRAQATPSSTLSSPVTDRTDPYEIIGVRRDASLAEIRISYRTEHADPRARAFRQRQRHRARGSRAASQRAQRRDGGDRGRARRRERLRARLADLRRPRRVPGRRAVHALDRRRRRAAAARGRSGDAGRLRRHPGRPRGDGRRLGDVPDVEDEAPPVAEQEAPAAREAAPVEPDEAPEAPAAEAPEEAAAEEPEEAAEEAPSRPRASRRGSRPRTTRRTRCRRSAARTPPTPAGDPSPPRRCCRPQAGRRGPRARGAALRARAARQGPGAHPFAPAAHPRRLRAARGRRRRRRLLPRRRRQQHAGRRPVPAGRRARELHLPERPRPAQAADGRRSSSRPSRPPSASTRPTTSSSRPTASPPASGWTAPRPARGGSRLTADRFDESVDRAAERIAAAQKLKAKGLAAARQGRRPDRPRLRLHPPRRQQRPLRLCLPRAHASTRSRASGTPRTPRRSARPAIRS